MKKIVVFGGTGYIGSFLCAELVKEGFEVISISKSGMNKYHKEPIPNVKYIQANIFKDVEWREELKNCDVVIHSIGLLFQKKKATYKKLIFETTQLIADASVDNNIKNFVYISAVKPPFFLFRKYHKSKMEAESLLRKKHFNLKVVRPRIVSSEKKPLFLLLYKLQEFSHFPFKQFCLIEDVIIQIVKFLK